MEPLRVCVVGLGPRGLSVLERLCANAEAGVAGERKVWVHVVDPHPPGPGRVWRTSQHRLLLMNTVASQVTMFTDESVTMAGPVRSGPSLAEWANFLTLMGPLEDYDDWVYEEARRIGPDTYSTRAFYGQYLRWVFWRVLSLAPPTVRVVVHRSHVVDLYENPVDGSQRAVLADGTRIESLNAIVLAQGHVPTTLPPRAESLATFARQHRLRYVPPINPADVDLSVISPGAPVMLAGLGLCFFDHVTLLTTGRGGTFERVDGELTYRPSGREPRIYAGSRRGVPYHSRGENQKGAFGRHLPVLLTAPVIAQLRSTVDGGIDFIRDLWPLIAKEVETVYYATLVAARGCACDVERFRTRTLALPWGSTEEADLLDQTGIPADQRWHWQKIEQPLAGLHFTDPSAFRSWMLEHLRRDVAEARRGNVNGPLKAALDVLRDLRNEVRLAVDHGGLDGALPPRRPRRLVHPAERVPVDRPAGLAYRGDDRADRGRACWMIGPGRRSRSRATAAGHFTVESPAVTGRRRVAVRTALIEARLPANPTCAARPTHCCGGSSPPAMPARHRIADGPDGGVRDRRPGRDRAAVPPHRRDRPPAPAPVRLRRTDRVGALGDRRRHPSGRGLGDAGRLRRHRAGSAALPRRRRAPAGRSGRTVGSQLADRPGATRLSG